MKILIISILFCLTVNAQNVWYVNGNSPISDAAADGTSRETGWHYIGAQNERAYGIDWSVISGGDTIYVCGGDTAVYYYPYYYGQAHHFGTTGNYHFNPAVVIARDWMDGYNGIPYIAIADTQVKYLSLWQNKVNNVKVTGLYFRDMRDPNNFATGGSFMSIAGDSIDIDNCHFITKALCPAIGINGLHCRFGGNTFVDPPNEYTYAQDYIGINTGRGGHIIENNLFMPNNNYTMVSGDAANVTITDTSFTDLDLDSMKTNYHVGTYVKLGTFFSSTYYMRITSNTGYTFYGTGGWKNASNDSVGAPSPNTWFMEGAHRDGLQISTTNYYAGDTLTTIIRGNRFVDLGTRGTGWNSMVYSWSTEANTRFMIYNNIFANKEEVSSGGIVMGEYIGQDTIYTGIYLLNNTFIIKGQGGADSTGAYQNQAILDFGHIDTLVVKNNIVICDTTIALIINMGPPAFDYKDFDYNIYGFDGANSFVYTDTLWKGPSNVTSWDEWRDSLGYDTHSDTVFAENIVFVNKFDSSSASYYTTTGRDLGEDLSVSYPYLVAEFPDLATDILGNPRSGIWDIGALEYVSGLVDTVPSFSFTGLNDKELNTAYIDSATFSGADSTFNVWTTTGARFNINSSSSLSTTMKTAVNGDMVYVETVTGASYSTGYTETIVAGGVSRDFTVTTKAEPAALPGGKLLKSNGNKGLFFKGNKAIIMR